MASIPAFVGVPKRATCNRCSNPIFLAERISFGEKSYHRSCLKCARCGTQLTVGSFYETETDGEYCCETCPDEEIQLAQRRESSASSESSHSSISSPAPVVPSVVGLPRGVRSSKLLDRISFFESAPLSDEEKTSNLERKSRMSSFLKETLAEGQDKPPDLPIAPPPKAHSADEQPDMLPVDPEEPERGDVEDEFERLVQDLGIDEPASDITSSARLTPNEGGKEIISEPSNSTEDPAVVPSTVQDADQSYSEELQPLPMVEKDPEDANNVIPEPKGSLDEPVTSNDTQTVSLDEPGANANNESSENMPEELNTELKLLPEDPVESKKTEAEVPEDDKSVPPTVEIESVDQTVEDDNKARPVLESSTNDEERYPTDLNPFGDDDDEEACASNGKLAGLQKLPAVKPVPTARHISTNPFGSEDEDDDTPQSPSSKPPRPPPPKVKTNAATPISSNAVPANPFGDDDEDEEETQAEEPAIVPVVSKPSPRRTPVPTPRKAHAYNDSVSSLDNSLMSSSRLSSSNVSLASSLESGPSSMVVQKRKKGKAPDVPVPLVGGASPRPVVGSSGAEKTSTENLSNSSGSGTLTTPRKKRPAPAPPPVPTSSSTPKHAPVSALGASAAAADAGLTRAPSQRLLALDASLIGNEHDSADPVSRAPSNESVVYRRTIVPLVLDEDGPESPVHGGTHPTTITSERQWEKMKDNKESQNRNRQSQSSPISEGNGSSGFGSLSILSNKSSQGKWKRRKGPAPALPMIAAPLPERKPIKMLPLKEIHQELQIIETQQQGLEKQGIVLEKMIRERCEGVEADVDLDIRLQANSKEVEDLIMQLFELVNEKNELFRRQAELMYLRRMHRLEQEQADLEYEIRLLMAQPERNKTDSDKEKEEALIARLVEIVQLRNEVVECLEMDRIREAEEDLSIKQSIEERAASQQSKHGSSKKESSSNSSSTLPLTDAEKRDSSTKLSKKEKKKLKEAKKLSKSKKIDSEKDADETESSATKEKKKKRKFLF
uniref:LIM zinc-binding domain-containing protein n=1 Tax=Anopheles atroparvus TaxID=41427 RepID=A0A182JMU3_ANOAO